MSRWKAGRPLGVPILFSLPIRVIQESRREKEVPTEAPVSAKSSVQVETQPPSSAGAGSKAPSVERPQSKESGTEDGKAAGQPASLLPRAPLLETLGLHPGPRVCCSPASLNRSTICLLRPGGWACEVGSARGMASVHSVLPFLPPGLAGRGRRAVG